jgi:predicted DNA-binding transcriptional regulator AlpA
MARDLHQIDLLAQLNVYRIYSSMFISLCNQLHDTYYSLFLLIKKHLQCTMLCDNVFLQLNINWEFNFARECEFMHSLLPSLSKVISIMQWLRTKQVLDKVSISRSTLRLWVRDGRFPAPKKLSSRIVVWDSALVDRFMEETKGK